MITNSALSKAKLGQFFMDSPDFTELNVPEITRLSSNVQIINNLIINNDNLKRIIFPALEQQPGILLGKNLQEIQIPLLQVISNKADIINAGILSSKFLQNTKLQTLELPELVGTMAEENNINSATQMGFAYNYWLKEVSLGNAYLEQTINAFFGAFWFYYNFSLQKLILRYPFVLPLANTAGITTTPIAYGKGFIYVPDNLITDYQAASNWITFKDCFKPITQLSEHLPTEDTIEDNWETIISKCNTHSLTSEYTVGATKTIEINGMPTQMVIVDLNKDLLADNSGNTASITWMEKHISRYNPITMNVEQGALRSHLNITNFYEIEKPAILNGLPEIVRNNIKTVTKNTREWLSPEGTGLKPSQEDIWIPSASEVGLQQSATTQIEPNSDIYEYFSGANHIGNNVFPFGFTNRYPIKDVNGVALRTFTSTSNYADSIDRNGRFVSGENSKFPQYLIIGFCT